MVEKAYFVSSFALDVGRKVDVFGDTQVIF